MKLEQIEINYKIHSDLYNEVIQIIEKNEFENEFPIYYEVLTDCSNRLDTLFTSLMLIAKNGDMYSSQILYRAIIELFYKTFFLTSLLSKEKNDESAQHFKVHLFLSEWIAVQMGCLEMDDLVNEVESKTNFVQYIRDKFPNLREFNKANQKEISQAIRKFGLKEIVKYLNDSFSEKEIGNFFTKILPEYSKASSFVHGGPYASTIVKNFQKKGEIQTELERIVSIAFSCVSIAKENCLFSFKLHPDDMIDLLNKFHEIRKNK